ncbi:hypothetical protein BJV74DRAFT_104255 [Russula compacta]|nr:hypothetical protein BJV74DRAFT_104255 [Russula compacta]
MTVRWKPPTVSTSYCRDVQQPSCCAPSSRVYKRCWGITFNRQPDGQGGEGDSIGVWRENNRAWKIFSSRDNLPRIKGFYNTAEVHGLPMGGLEFREGTVQQGAGRATNGFVLITRWLVGSEFNFHRPPKPFNSALRDQNISHSRSSVQYQRILGGCRSANTVGLRDVQGKVDGTAGVYEPIAFFDVHTSTSSEQAQSLVDDITAWGTLP